MTYFRRYYEAPDDSGATPVDTPEPDAPEGAEAAAEAPEAPAEAPVTFTAEQLAEHLPQFQERFLAHHDPTEALALYGQRDRNVQAALTRYTQGNPTDGDIATLREGGYDLPEPQEQEEVEEPPMWDAPWAPMEDWNRVEAYANSEHPQHRQMAVEAVWDHPGVPPEYKDWALARWAEIDNFGAHRFYTEKATARAEEAAAAKLEERLQAFEERLTPIDQRVQEADYQALVANTKVLVQQARETIPDFAEHEAGVIKIIEERASYDPTYLERLFKLPADQQLREFSDMTGAAAWRSRPEAEAQAQAEADAAEAAKQGAAGQRGRGANGANSNGMTDAKREHLAAFQRLEGVEVR